MGCAAPQAAAAPSPRPSVAPSSRCFADRYELGEKLGRGSFAQVRAATRAPDSRPPAQWPESLAVKIQSLDDSGPGRGALDLFAKRAVLEEARTWKLASGLEFGHHHRNVVRFCEMKIEGPLAFIVMERCDLNLKQYLQQGAGEEFLTERSWGRTLEQMLEACSHIHSQLIVHNDIKPDNWIVTDGVVKMCDFGLATRLATKTQLLVNPRGTAPYMSPEMLNKQGYGTATDLFAVGVIAYLMFYGSLPYRADSAREMRRVIKEGRERPKYQPATESIAAVSAKAAAFCAALLHRNPEKRAGAEQALALPFLKGLGTMAQDLPSLQPAIDAAVRVGCFGQAPSQGLTDPLDVLLEKTFVSKKLQGSSEASTEASTTCSSNFSRQVS